MRRRSEAHLIDRFGEMYGVCRHRRRHYHFSEWSHQDFICRGRKQEFTSQFNFQFKNKMYLWNGYIDKHICLQCLHLVLNVVHNLVPVGLYLQDLLALRSSSLSSSTRHLRSSSIAHFQLTPELCTITRYGEHAFLVIAGAL